MNDNKKGTYGYDRDFLSKYHTNLIELKSTTGTSAILVCPQYQGRVMTSTANGSEGFSFGWVNYKLIEAGQNQPHINAYGGEERLWLGPEGGQFSFYFKKGQSFEFENWQVPKEIDTEPFEIVKRGFDFVNFSKQFLVTNYSDIVFNIFMERNLQLISNENIKKNLSIQFSENVNVVAYESANIITNNGKSDWDSVSGMPSIWMLCMFIPTPHATVVIPFNNEPNSDEMIVNDNYFGKVPAERLKIIKNGIFFKTDGKHRSKIGLNYNRAKDVLGCWDPDNSALTILQYNKPFKKSTYVNSKWELQQNPFEGDIINSYNDGPVADGSQMGPFFELESSSQAANLKPNESFTHMQRIYHFQGNKQELDKLAQAILGFSLDEIEHVFENQ